MPAQRPATAIVTGASSGLGKAFAQMLLDEGVAVWGTSRDGERLPAHPRCHPCALDLREAASVEAFLRRIEKELPHPDLLINNAGYGTFAPFEQFPEEEIQRQLDVLLLQPIRLCRALYPVMKRQGQGIIVNVASLACEFPLPCMSLYNTAKAGLSRFSRSLQMEAQGTGVVIVDFQPGDYRTPFNQQAQRKVSEGADSPAWVQTAWAKLEQHLQEAPNPERAARDLRRILRSGKSGTYASGSFFQATLGPLFSSVAPWALTHRLLRHYYSLDNPRR